MNVSHKQSQALISIALVFMGCLPTLAGATVVHSNTTQLREGIFRYHYDTQITRCSCVLLIGVGTTMKVGDCDLLAAEIARAREDLIVGIIDHAPGNPIKLSANRFAKLANAINAELKMLVPPCRKVPVDSKHRKPKILLGGHSASGGAAMRALTLLDFAPAGFVGLSPYRITDNMRNITISSLFWGFSKTTCGVDIGHAADAAYSLSSPKSGRVLYQLQNPDDQPSHCTFADNGCPICHSSDSEDYNWIRSAVGESVGKFIRAIETNTFRRAVFDLDVPTNQLMLFVNEDYVVTLPSSNFAADGVII